MVPAGHSRLSGGGGRHLAEHLHPVDQRDLLRLYPAIV